MLPDCQHTKPCYFCWAPVKPRQLPWPHHPCPCWPAPVPAPMPPRPAKSQQPPCTTSRPHLEHRHTGRCAGLVGCSGPEGHVRSSMRGGGSRSPGIPGEGRSASRRRRSACRSSGEDLQTISAGCRSCTSEPVLPSGSPYGHLKAVLCGSCPVCERPAGSALLLLKTETRICMQTSLCHSQALCRRMSQTWEELGYMPPARVVGKGGRRSGMQ